MVRFILNTLTYSGTALLWRWWCYMLLSVLLYSSSVLVLRPGSTPLILIFDSTTSSPKKRTLDFSSRSVKTPTAGMSLNCLCILLSGLDLDLVSTHQSLSLVSVLIHPGLGLVGLYNTVCFRSGRSGLCCCLSWPNSLEKEILISVGASG